MPCCTYTSLLEVQTPLRVLMNKSIVRRLVSVLLQYHCVSLAKFVWLMGTI